MTQFPITLALVPSLTPPKSGSSGMVTMGCYFKVQQSRCVVCAISQRVKDESKEGGIKCNGTIGKFYKKTNFKRNNVFNEPSLNVDSEIRVSLNPKSGVTCDGSPKVGYFSPLVSPSTTINIPRRLDSIDVGATFEVSLTTIGDLRKLINDIEAGKHDELLSGMTNDDRRETMDALGTICNSIQADNNNTDVIPCKVSHMDDSINVDESTIPNDLIVQSVDINIKSTSYTGAAGTSEKDQPKVSSNFRTVTTVA
ncbi:hypothetical protein Tco_1103880 [Tanacetum coccineum]